MLALYVIWVDDWRELEDAFFVFGEDNHLLNFIVDIVMCL